ncbi:response regulator [Desulfobacula sp.]|uniref:response regulator n=1 Tax=Desulfobacula sp. TaxID=2593537 RepID=UPI002614EB21|nr:response regulator [Desulfobacula sp.]
MDVEPQHKVLVVDPDEQVGKAIDQILPPKKIGYVFTDSGESALEQIKKTKDPFALILADQHLKDMKGTRLLEQAKALTPDSIRFLMAGSPEMDIIIKAVNSGVLQRYIVKPWEQKDLANAIQSGIQQHDFFLDNETLLTLAKKQNARLYELNCELMETTTSHGKEIHELDHGIKLLKKQIKDPACQTPLNPDPLLSEIENWVKAPQGIDSKKVTLLFSDTINGLYGQFKDLARQSGFEMPDVTGETQ